MSYAFPEGYFDPVQQEEARRKTISEREEIEKAASRNRPAKFYPEKLADGTDLQELGANYTTVPLILRHLRSLNQSTVGVEKQLANVEA
jgi:hypothetical protein